MTSYQIISASIVVDSDSSTITRPDFEALREYFGTEKDFLFAKINQTHIPVEPKNIISDKTIIEITNDQSDEFGIEESENEPVMIENPDSFEWMT